MAISGLIVRSGVGAWEDIAHLITRGLNLGAVVIVEPPPVDEGGPTTWVEQSPHQITWTSQSVS